MPLPFQSVTNLRRHHIPRLHEWNHDGQCLEQESPPAFEFILGVNARCDRLDTGFKRHQFRHEIEGLRLKLDAGQLLLKIFVVRIHVGGQRHRRTQELRFPFLATAGLG